MIKALIFDLDGVLLDTSHYHFESWKKVFAPYGIELHDEDNEQLKGAGRMESLEYIAQKGNLELDEETKISIAAEKNDIYKSSISHIGQDGLYPGVLDFLSLARSLKLKIALGSGSKNAKTIIYSAEVGDLFDALCDGTDITNSKPHPEIFQTAIDRLGVEPNEAIVFEDASKGIDAAKAAGCFSIGIGLQKNLPHADLVFDGLSNVPLHEVIKHFNSRLTIQA